MSLPNPEELRQMILNGTKVIIVCRSAHEPLMAGFTRGHHCIFCDEEVQMSKRAKDQVATGGMITCNPCGINLAEWANSKGTLEKVMVSPEAEAGMQRSLLTNMRDRIERLMKNNPPK